MNRPLTMPGPLFALALVGVLAAPAHAYPSREWRFRVLLDDKPIGNHVYWLSLDKGQQVLKSEADFGVRFLGFNAYRYEHVAVERWEGGCLQTIESRTDDNGEEFSVSGRKTDSGFVLDGPQGSSELPAGCVMSFAYWNPQILKQTRLLNAQNGEYLPVQVQSLGTESLVLSNSNVVAKRYRLITSKFSIDLWYGSNNQWLALETRTEGGRVLRYEIANFRYGLLGNKHYA
jgi:hypothetical protein